MITRSLVPGLARRSVLHPAIALGLLMGITLTLPARPGFAQNPSVNINFQPAGIAVPSGDLPDTGLAYANRGNGFSYGWNLSHSSRAKYYPPPFPGMNLRFWTLIEMMSASSTKWEIGLPSGTYQVTIGAGGPLNTGVRQQIRAEGVMVVDDMPTDYGSWVGGTASVTVSDGRLTVTNASGATKNWMTFIEIVAQ